MRHLTPNNATINTVSVQISALKIDNRQVTQSVFKQLLVEDIFDWDKMALKGVAWGHVRHLIDYHQDDSIHLIWQKGNELRRCITHKRCNDTKESYDRYDKRNYLLKSIVNYKVNLYYRNGDSHMRHEKHGIDDSIKFLTNYTSCYADAYAEVEFYPNVIKINLKFTLKNIQSFNDNVEFKNSLINEINIHGDKVKIERDRILMLMDKRDLIVSPLFDLPQLFIAA